MAIADSFLFDPNAVPLPSGSLINGKLICGEGRAYAVVRPSDGETLKTERGADAALVDRAVSIARTSFQSGVWSHASPEHRAQVFRRWADLAQAHAAELVALESVVSTRIASEAALRDIPVTINIIRYYGEWIDKIEGQVLASPSQVLNMVLREPHGVVAAISPWNVPLMLATVKLAPALAAGNAVILKPSEFTPYSIIRLAQLAIEAGVPAGQIAVLSGNGPETGHALITHPDIDYVSFTGSTATGARVMSDAAMSGPKPVSLEMGGKSPQLVFADADIDRSARIVAGAATRNGGQICYAGTRLLVHRSVAEPFVERVAAYMSGGVPGPTWSTETTLSPIISIKQIERIEAILARGIDAGAETVIGGQPFDTHAGFFFRPTIVKGADANNPIVREEIFGPVLSVQTFDDVEEAIALADHEDYGLAAGVYTNNLATAIHSARALKVGTVWINKFGVSDVLSPVGGYKKSGFGKDFGLDGILKYMKTKNVSFETML